MELTENEKMVWEEVLTNITESDAFAPQIRAYLKGTTIEHPKPDEYTLLFPNMLTKDFVDKSGIVNIIRMSLMDKMGTSYSVNTEVGSTSSEDKSEESPQQEQAVHEEPKHLERIEKNFPQKSSSTSDEFHMKYTFESFVVGESNQMAYGVSLAVAERPAEVYNPLFIYGRSGLGKTHLLIAISNYITQNYQNLKVYYLTARELVDDIVQMSRIRNWELFNTKYIAADILLIDDIQYLEGKEESIERVFQLLNEFIQKRKQIVLSADRSPRNINMDERMTSRFMAGMVQDIQPPTFETKLAVLKSYRQRFLDNTNIGDDVLEYIATISNSNIREIEGALFKISSHLSIGVIDEMTVDMAREILRDYFPEKNARSITISMIQQEVEKNFGITHEDMVGSKRTRSISWPRQVAMYLARSLTDESFPAIGKKFGGRDHTTIMHGVDTVEERMKENRTVYDRIEKISNNIKNRA